MSIERNTSLQELAQKLKDAGFPQNKTKRILLHLAEKTYFDQKRKEIATRPEEWKIIYSRNAIAAFPRNEWLAYPFFEEIMEECKSDFKVLTSYDVGSPEQMMWIMRSQFQKSKYAIFDFLGRTPFEALTHFYVHYHSKNK